MRRLIDLRRLVPVAALSVIASGIAGAQSVMLEFSDLNHVNTQATLQGDLVIEHVDVIDWDGRWYRYPWGYDVWDIQLQKNTVSPFNGLEGCLRAADNLWAIEPLHEFNGRLMRVGPRTGAVYLATLDNNSTLPVPEFASRPASLRIFAFGSHSGWSNCTVTLNYATGAPVTIVVPIADASVYPRNNAGSGWQTQGVDVFVSVCAGRYGDMVEIPNPRPTADLISAAIVYGSGLSGPLAVSLSLSRAAYEAGYTFAGSAESGIDQQTAMRAPEGSVSWSGLDWSATISEPNSSISVDVYCGEAGAGGSVWWQHAGTVALTAGTGSSEFLQPCPGEYVMCTIDMVAEFATSPVLHRLEFVYSNPTDASGAMPTVLRLHPNQPNPFNPQTAIRYDVPADGQTTLRIYDVRGALVRTLVDADLPRGSRQAAWDGRDASGRAMPSGSYFVRLAAGGKVETARMALVR